MGLRQNSGRVGGIKELSCIGDPRYSGAPEARRAAKRSPNAAIDQSMYPAAWKKGQITPIPKGSDSEIDKTLFRPVTVLPAMNNIFEKILASQLTSYFQGVLSDFLSAYRKHHSCHTTLLRLVED